MSKLNNFSKSTKVPVFGIDLGTTNSAISIVDNSGIANCLELDNGKTTMPSCVLWDSNSGEFIVGDKAYAQRYKSNACYSVKRLMGTDKIITFEHAGKKITKTPAEVSAIILKGLISKVKMYKDIEEVVITVPAGFNIRQIEDTKKAAELAGLKVLNIMREPTAASLVYRLDKEPGNILVYDLGGGTFDVSIVNVKKGSSGESDLLSVLGMSGDNSKDSITVIDTRGNNKLGGDDLDQEIYSILENKIIDKFGISSKLIGREDKEKLILKIEQYKKSADYSSVEIYLDWVLTNGKKIKGTVDFTTDDFRLATKKIYKKTKVYINEVLKSSNINIHSIVLVGGSTKNVLLQQMLKEDYPDCNVCNYLNPDEAVSLGAAVQAKRLKYGSDTLEVFDVTSNPIGVLSDGRVTPLIEKNQSLPCTITKTFTTSIDNQKFVDICVYEGSSIYPQECEYLGDLVVKGLPKAKAGTLAIVVTLVVDSDGLLQVETTIDGKKNKVTLMNILGKKLEVEDKKSLILFDRWYSYANKLEEPFKSELLDLINEAKTEPGKKLAVVKYISKISKQEK